MKNLNWKYAKRNGAKTPATHTAPEHLVSEAEGVEPKLRDPVETLEALGKLFVRNLDDDTKKTGRFKPGGQDELWGVQPIALPNGWHHDLGTKWNFNVFEGRLHQAASDAEMAKGVR